MRNDIKYNEGDKVWIQITEEGATAPKRPAIIISMICNRTPFKDENYIAIRYEDIEGYDAFGCVPQSWVTERM